MNLSTLFERLTHRSHRDLHAFQRKPRGILLDIDGTLLDSNDAHASAWFEALGEHGIRSEVAFVRRLVGMGADRLLPYFGVREDSARGRAISARHDAIFSTEHLPHLQPFAGTRELVKRMKSAGMKRIVATSASGDALHALLKAAKIEDLIDDAATSTDAASSKPAPDIVDAAKARAHEDPRRLVMIGDTPYDVAAARSAGVRVLGMRCGGWGDADLLGAACVYRDPADLVARWDESILAG